MRLFFVRTVAVLINTLLNLARVNAHEAPDEEIRDCHRAMNATQGHYQCVSFEERNDNESFW